MVGVYGYNNMPLQGGRYIRIVTIITVSFHYSNISFIIIVSWYFYRFFSSVPSKYLESLISLCTFTIAACNFPKPIQANFIVKYTAKENLTVSVLCKYDCFPNKHRSRAAKYGNIIWSSSMKAIGSIISRIIHKNSTPSKPRISTRSNRRFHAFSPSAPTIRHLTHNI